MRPTFIPIVLTIALMVAVPLSGCSATGLKLGNIVTEKRDVTDFTSVDVGGPFEATITQSDSFSTTTSVEADFSDYITVAKEGETLKIYLSSRHPFTDFTSEARTFKVKITMPALRGLRLSGATKTTIDGFKSSQDFSLDISGASSLSMENIEAGNAEFRISGASKISGGFKASDVKLAVSGACKVDLRGSANNLTLDASGANNLNLLDFPLNTASVKLSGASEATVNVKTSLDPVLSDSSKLYFQGNPAINNMNISGASTIKHK